MPPMGFGPFPLEADVSAEHVNELPIPAELFGVIGFLLLLAMLMITLAIGKGRPHS